MLPKSEKERIFDGIDKVGNVRIDRIVVGIGLLEKNNFEMFVRITGKANPGWLIEAFKGARLRTVMVARIRRSGSFVLFTSMESGPAMALSTIRIFCSRALT